VRPTAARRAASARLKQARLIHAARAYLAGLGRTPPCRFDVVAEQAGQLTWLRDAFQVSE
jgi:putative endonuclease